MRREETVGVFQTCIERWYSSNGRGFPWRFPDAGCYERVISEILLQRTRAETVAGFFRVFVERYPFWDSIAASSEEALEDVLKPIGLWRQRASALIRLSRALKEREYSLPESRDELQKLPGVGQYVANAIMMFCHGEAWPLLDSNMSRVLERFFGRRVLADIRYDQYLQELSKEVVEVPEPERINWGVLDLAALVCRKKPRCDVCPLKQRCFYANNPELWATTKGFMAQSGNEK